MYKASSNECIYKYFDKNNKSTNLLVNDKEILKTYLEIWDKIKGLSKKEFNSEPV